MRLDKSNFSAQKWHILLVATFPSFVGVKKNFIELVSGFESKCQSIVGSLIDSDPYGMVTVKNLYKIILGLLT